MATTLNNTGNAVGSTDAKDLQDNAIVFDKLLNSSGTVVNRLGETLESYPSLMAKMKETGGALGYADMTSLLASTPSAANTLALDTSTGNWYFWDGSSWTPASWQLVNQIAQVNNTLAALVSLSLQPVSAYSGSSKLSDTLSLENDGILLLNSVVKSNTITDGASPTTTITVAGATQGTILTKQFFPGDNLSGGTFTRSARPLLSKDWSESVTGIVSDSVVRIRDDSTTGYTSAIIPDKNSIQGFDASGTLVSCSAASADTVTEPSVSTHTGGNLQISIPINTLTAAGYSGDVAGAQKYISEKLSGIELYYQSSDTYTASLNNIIPISADDITFTVSNAYSTYSMGVYTEDSSSALEVSEASRNEEAYTRSLGSKLTQRLYSGNINELSINTRGKKRIKVDFLSTSNGASGAQVLNVNLDGSLSEQKAFPPGGFIFEGDSCQGYFKPLRFSATVFDSIQYRDGSSTVSPSAAKFVLVKFSPNLSDMNYSDDVAVVDQNQNFPTVKGSTAGTVNQTTSSISGGASNGIGVVQFTIPAATLTSAGISLTDQSAIREYIAEKMIGSVIWVRLNTLTTLDDVSSFLDFVVGSGELTLTTSQTTIDLMVSIFTEHEAPLFERTGYHRQTAQVTNTSGVALTSSLVGLKVQFPAGTVFDSDGILVADSDGNTFASQFADEFHPNPRQLSNVGYHLDGSLATGQVYFRDSFSVGETKYYEIRSFATPVQDNPKTSLQVSTSATETSTLTFGGYVFTFVRSRGWNLSNIADSSGNALNIALQHTPSNASGTATETVATYSPSLRVVNSGSIFVDVEAITYNQAASGYLDAGVVKFRTIYRIFSDGKFIVKTYVTSVKEIAVNKLTGCVTRLDFTGYTPTLNSSIASIIGTLPNNANLGVVLIHNTGDQHRDGTNYGPNRPAIYQYLNPSDTSRRLYTGWKITSLSDYSLLNWPVTKDWTWTHAIYIDLNCAQTDAATLANVVHNPPTGFAGESGFALVKKRKILRQLKDFVDGSMDWWYSNTDSSLGDGSGKLASVTYEIMRAMYDGTHTLDYMYDRAVNYIDTYWKSFSDPGTYYLNNDVVLQWASRMTIPVYHWLYKWAEKEGDTTKTAAIAAAMKSYATAALTHYNTNGGINLNGAGTGPGNSNSNATGAVIFALAVYMGQDDSAGSFAAAAKAILSTIETSFAPIANVLLDGKTDVLANAHWSHYQMFAWNNYFIANELLSRTPVLVMDNYVCAISSAMGAFHDVDYCVSESRRGNFNTLGFASYPILAMSNASLMNFLEKSISLTDSEYGSKPGFPRRFYGFDGTQAGSVVSDVGFNGTNMSEPLIRAWINS